MTATCSLTFKRSFVVGPNTEPGNGGSAFLYPQAQLAVGDVLCHPEWPVPLAVRLTARLLVLDVAVPILRGQQVSIWVQPAPLTIQ